MRLESRYLNCDKFTTTSVCSIPTAQYVEGRGCWRKRRSLCNAKNKGSRFALSERKQTSNAYQLHEEAGGYAEKIK